LYAAGPGWSLPAAAYSHQDAHGEISVKMMRERERERERERAYIASPNQTSIGLASFSSTISYFYFQDFLFVKPK
jgi:hypothetical protein